MRCQMTNFNVCIDWKTNLLVIFYSVHFYRRIIHHYLLMLAFIWPQAFDKDYIRIKKVSAPDDEAIQLP